MGQTPNLWWPNELGALLVAAGLGTAAEHALVSLLALNGPGQTVVSSGPYRWLRHPSYTGQWL